MRVLLLSVLVLATAIAQGARAAPAEQHTTQLTVYRSDDDALFNAADGGSVNSGHAVVREPRTLDLRAGTQDVTLGGLPLFLDAEALSLSVTHDAARVLSQRLRLGQGPNAALGDLLGRQVDVLGAGGHTLVAGTLLRAGDGLVVRDAAGNTSLVRDYAAVNARGDVQAGSTLALRLDAAQAGRADAVLSYPTAGIGWRAAYVGTLQAGDRCRIALESRASIANRSGRDWSDAQLKLIAGEPRFAKTNAPRPMLRASFAAAAKDEAAELPAQSALADYRSYDLAGPVGLPDGTISQTPLYATRALDCERTLLYETGGNWHPAQPMLSEDFNQGDGNTITSSLRFKAFDRLPAGFLRVLQADRGGIAQFIGEGRIEDTPKGGDAGITLGTAFDLRAERERTVFKVDQAARRMDESFRITLSNAGDSARTITVREHPGRWRNWSLTSSSNKPSKQTPDLLEFRLSVPANGKVTLDYAVRYTWTAEQHPQ